MEWEKAFTLPNGAPRKYYGTLKVPKEFAVKDGQRLDLRVMFGARSETGSFGVVSFGELHLPAPLARDIEDYARANPQASVRFRSVGADPAATVLEELNADEPHLASLPATERQALVAARLGQGLFRTRLMEFWHGSCAVTGTAIPALLRASHIKPWRISDDVERLDPENGLMLVANLDAAFDAKLVSFDANGGMLFSAKLGPAPHTPLGIAAGLRLARPPSKRQRSFLVHHRQAAGLG